jgi:hypothetical protein
MKNTLIITLVLFIALHNNLRAQDEQGSGLAALSVWVNQAGSTFSIDNIDSNGQITGTYINREAGYGCQNSSYPVTGWVFGTAITFTVIWENSVESCNSITSWTGFYYNSQISTLWQLVINGSTSTSQIIKGSDTFTRSSVIVNKSLANK